MSEAKFQPVPPLRSKSVEKPASLTDLEVLNTLHRISEGGGLSLRERLTAIVKVVAFHLKSDACSIYLEESGSGLFNLAATQGLNPEAVGKVHLAPGEGVTGWVGRECIPLPIEDVGSDARFKVVRGVGEEAYQSILAAPIRMDQRLIGVINIQSKTMRDYDASQIYLMETIGHHLGGIIRGAQHFEETKKQLRHQRLINGIGQALVSTLHLDPLLEMVMVKSRELTRTRGGVLRLWDDALQQFVVRVTTGDLLPAHELRPLYLGEGIAGNAALKQERYLINVGEQSGPTLPEGVRNYLCVPVVYQGRAIGTISVFDRDPGAESERLSGDDVALLQALANQVAVAIRNAQACDELSTRVEKLKQERDLVVREATLDAVGRMGKNMVRHVRGPLIPIERHARRLLDGALSEQQRRMSIEAILSESRRLNGFLSGVLAMAQGDAVELEPTQVDPLVAEVVDGVQAGLANRGITISQSLNSGCTLYLDPLKFTQVVQELLGNAVAALPNGGEIQVRTEQCCYPVDGVPVEGSCIAIRDSGKAIPDSQITDLFSPFLVTREGSDGLGLATAYRISRAHGGSLLAHNPPDGGAEFTVFLPELPLRSDVPQPPTQP